MEVPGMKNGDAKTITVISGASRGIGLELTRQLLALGHHVYAGVRDVKKATHLSDLEKSNTGALKVFELDITSDTSVAKFREAVEADQKAQLGNSKNEGRVDLLINNAGIYVDTESDFASLPATRILESFDTNTVGPIRLTRAFQPLLRKAKAPRIANLSSVMGSVAETSSGAFAYRMSKAALNMFTKCMAGEEREMITLSLHPGWVQTDMGGKGANITPEVSARGLLEVITKSSLKNSGHFYAYDGKEIAW
jgi:NAD(P)-dependent dehydrogenase (short-subunit alcohol dehydrogenase family)